MRARPEPIRQDQLQLNITDYTTLVQQFPGTTISRTLQFQPGTNFKPRTSAGLELVVQLPIVQAPFRIYWAYNFNRMSEVITAPVTQFPGPVSTLTTPCVQYDDRSQSVPVEYLQGPGAVDGYLEFPGSAADFEFIQQPAADEFLRSGAHVPVHGEPDVLIADFAGSEFSMWDCRSESPDKRQGSKLVLRGRMLRNLGRTGMSWWKFSTILTLAAALGALGCGGSSSSGVAITISPTTASVITNRTQLFSGLVTGSSNTAITWTLTCATGVTANTCGSIDATGLYTAPATIPTITSSGTTTIAPTVTITGHRASRYDQNGDGHPDHRHRNQHHHYADHRYRGHGREFPVRRHRQQSGVQYHLQSHLSQCHLVAFHHADGNRHHRRYYRRLHGAHDGSLAKHCHHHGHVGGGHIGHGDCDGHRGDRDDSHRDLGEPEHDGIRRALPGYLHHRDEFHFHEQCLTSTARSWPPPSSRMYPPR